MLGEAMGLELISRGLRAAALVGEGNPTSVLKCSGDWNDIFPGGHRGPQISRRRMVRFARGQDFRHPRMRCADEPAALAETCEKRTHKADVERRERGDDRRRTVVSIDSFFVDRNRISGGSQSRYIAFENALKGIVRAVSPIRRDSPTGLSSGQPPLRNGAEQRELALTRMVFRLLTHMPRVIEG